MPKASICSLDIRSRRFCTSISTAGRGCPNRPFAQQRSPASFSTGRRGPCRSEPRHGGCPVFRSRSAVLEENEGRAATACFDGRLERTFLGPPLQQVPFEGHRVEVARRRGARHAPSTKGLVFNLSPLVLESGPTVKHSSPVRCRRALWMTRAGGVALRPAFAVHPRQFLSDGACTCLRRGAESVLCLSRQRTRTDPFIDR